MIVFPSFFVSMKSAVNHAIKTGRWSKSKILAGVILIPLLLTGINCSGLGKRKSFLKTFEESRKTASFAPPGESRKASKSKKDLLNMMETGQAVISKAVYIKNEKPVCFMDTKGKRRLVPEFAYPSSRPSSVRFKKELPICGNNVKNHIASLTPNFFPEGERVAWGPLAGAALATIVGCVVGAGVTAQNENVTRRLEAQIEAELAQRKDIDGSAIEEYVYKYHRAQLQDSLDPVLGAAASGSIGGIIEMLSLNLPHNLSDRRVMLRFARGLGAGILGYVVCGKAIAYIIEEG